MENILILLGFYVEKIGFEVKVNMFLCQH